MIFGRYLPGYSEYIITRDGRVYSLISKKFLKPQKNSRGYLRVDLKGKGSNHNWKFIHIMVAQCFCKGGCGFKNQVNHKDHDITNNHFNNLEWTTPSYNVRHSRNHYLTKYRKGKYSHEQAKALAGTPF